MSDIWPYIGIFFAVLGESTIIVGSFVPGVNVVVFSSVLASTGKLSLALVFLCAWAGMFIGDHLGYVLGRYGLERIPAAHKQFNKIRPQVEKFVGDHSRLVVLYQFVGFARSPVPILLGVVRHPLKRWLSMLTVATTLFVGFLVGGSYAIGSAVGKDKALRVAVITQIVVSVLFTLFALKSYWANQKTSKSRQ